MALEKLASAVNPQKTLLSANNAVLVLFILSYVASAFAYIQISFLISMHFAHIRSLYTLLAIALSCQPLGTALIILLKMKYMRSINVRHATTVCEAVGCACAFALSLLAIFDGMAFLKLILLLGIGISNAFYMPYVAYLVKVLGHDGTYKPMSGALATARGAAAAAGPFLAAVSARMFGISLALFIDALILLASTGMLVAMWRLGTTSIRENLTVNMSALRPKHIDETSWKGRILGSAVTKLILLSCGINGLLIGPIMLLGYHYAATTPRGDFLWAQVLGVIGVSATLFGAGYSLFRYQGSFILITLSVLFSAIFCISLGWSFSFIVVLICAVMFGSSITITGITIDTLLQLSVSVDAIAYFSGLDTALSAIALTLGYTVSALALSVFDTQAVSVGASLCGFAIVIPLAIAERRRSIK